MSPVRVDPRPSPRPAAPTGQGRAPLSGQMPVDDATQQLRIELFRKLKPVCVALSSLGGQDPTPTSQHARLLSSLYAILSPAPQTAYSPALINYILLPLTRILRSNNPQTLPDHFLEATFRLLELVVRQWRACDGGLETTAWAHLWRLTIAICRERIRLGGGSGFGSAKGKEKEQERVPLDFQLGQETTFEAVKLLQALLSPDDERSPQGGYPTREMKKGWETAKSPLMPILFHTVEILVGCISPSPQHLPLQRTSLKLLRDCVMFLEGQPSVLAALLPGVVGGVSRLFSAEGRKLKGELAELAAGVLGEVIALTLADEELRNQGVLKPRVDDLSQLAEEWVDPPDPANASASPPTSSSPAPLMPSNSTTVDPFPPLTANYLAFTSSQLAANLPPILSNLQSHPSHLARVAAARLAERLLEQCIDSLQVLLPHALRTLLTLSRDPIDDVWQVAQKSLRALLKSNATLQNALIDILTQSMNALPRLILSGQDEPVSHLANLISAISDFSAHRPDARNPIADLLGPSGKIERWSRSLLECLEFGRPAGWSLPKTAGQTAQLGWQTGFATGITPLLLPDEAESTESSSNPALSPEQPFPSLSLRYIETAATNKAIQEMLVSLGRAGGDAVLHSVDYLLSSAATHRTDSPARSVSAVWVAEQLLDGLAARQMDDDGKVGRSTRKMCKQAVRAVVAMQESEDDYDGAGLDSSDSQVDSQELLPVERSQGIHALTTLLDRPSGPNASASNETRRLQAAAQQSMLTCASLRLLALASRILSSSFRPLLLNVLYDVLSHLASPVDIVREHAEIALAQIAYHTNYASPRNLILDNVDYVINVVSLRLTRARLSPAAPLVLIAMIRLVGSEIVPLVHDVVDEIFDALDDYHGYEALTAGLLAVLSTLVGELRAEVEASGVNEERRVKHLENRRIDEAPVPEKDLERFFTWWYERQTSRQAELDDILERVKASKEGFRKDVGDENQGEAPAGDEGERPATRSEQVCTSILAKSLNFLTHPSPFLRSRILLLIADAVPALASTARESDLLPLVDKGWSAILNRLDEEDQPAVVAAAAEVIAQLSEWVGDFMSRRILEHAWPRFSKMLDKQRDKDGRSALARRAGGTSTANTAGREPIGTDSAHTSSHRLYAAILKTVKWITAEVPVNDDLLWSFMLAFRPFLDSRAHPDLQSLAMDVYRALGKRDGDALWTCLSASIGNLQDDRDMWRWLAEERQRYGWELEPNAAILIAKAT